MVVLLSLLISVITDEISSFPPEIAALSLTMLFTIKPSPIAEAVIPF